MDYVIYNEEGHLTGAFSQDLREEHESFFIEISPEQRINWTLYKANSDRTGLDLLIPPEPSIEFRNSHTLAALAAIDLKTPRAVREALITGDKTRVEALEAEAETLRTMLVKD